MSKRRISLITSLADAEKNIRNYGRELRASAELGRRVGFAKAWYALRGPNDSWTFAPSKFVGYRYSSAAEYLADSGRNGDRDGRQTERALGEWFAPVDPNSPRGRELTEALRAFLCEYGKPNEKARINLLKSELEEIRARMTGETVHTTISDRISFDPRICGGNPCIKGTRMRVSDIVSMLADGATKAEILQDFDYLSEADIDAALHYAAGAADHPVIRTA